MAAPAPILATWTGSEFEPARRHAKTLDATLTIGVQYLLEIQEPHSEKARRHFFAQLHDIWISLPEDIAERWPSVESFRKAGLIATGFCDKTEAICATNKQAQALAASFGRIDDYVMVEIRDRAIAVWTARSQKRAVMGNDDFKASKQAVLEWAAHQVGVKAEDVAGDAI